MIITYQFEESDINTNLRLVNPYGTKFIVVSYGDLSYRYNLLNLENILVYDRPVLANELANYLNKYNFRPENQTSL